MAELIYLLCMATSLFCASLLARRYRNTRSRLLLWSTICFVGLAINNALLVIDLIVFPNDIDLVVWRASTAYVSLLVLLAGLVWEAR